MFKNLDEIFMKIIELELNKPKLRGKLKAVLAESKMAEVDQTLNTTANSMDDSQAEIRLGGFASSRSYESSTVRRKDEFLDRINQSSAFPQD